MLVQYTFHLRKFKSKLGDTLPVLEKEWTRQKKTGQELQQLAKKKYVARKPSEGKANFLCGNRTSKS